MRQYELQYWPGSGGEGRALSADEILLCYPTVVKLFEAVSDYRASQRALAIGMGSNSDGVDLYRLDPRGIKTKCYLAREDQPEIMSEGDLIP